MIKKSRRQINKRQIIRQLDKHSLARERGIIGYTIIDGFLVPLHDRESSGTANELSDVLDATQEKTGEDNYNPLTKILKEYAESYR